MAVQLAAENASEVGLSAVVKTPVLQRMWGVWGTRWLLVPIIGSARIYLLVGASRNRVFEQQWWNLR